MMRLIQKTILLVMIGYGGLVSQASGKCVDRVANTPETNVEVQDVTHSLEKVIQSLEQHMITGAKINFETSDPLSGRRFLVVGYIVKVSAQMFGVEGTIRPRSSLESFDSVRESSFGIGYDEVILSTVRILKKNQDKAGQISLDRASGF